MASVVRIKRRRTDDPAEALILSHKKSRVSTNPSVSDSGPSLEESVLEFAGTLASKDEPVSTHIREAIRKKKIHKEMHPHSSEFKMNHSTDLISKLRKQKTETSLNNRYRITFSRRALDIDNLDYYKGECKSETDEARSNKETIPRPPTSDEERENLEKLSEAVKECLHNAPSSDGMTAKCENGKDNDTLSPSAICNKICGTQEKDKKIYCLIDVEHEKGHDPVAKPTSSGITVNGIPMTQVKAKVPIAEESDDYVYDLYYTHTRLSDVQNEAVITVEALCSELFHEERYDESEDFVYDDDDDSNDESNWRNDYPDEDPHFFENAETDYDYKNDMRESVFHGDEEDDAGNMLSYWMGTRCKIGVEGDDFEEDYLKDGSSSDEAAGAELGDY